MGRIIDTADCGSEVMTPTAASTAEFLCDDTNSSCMNGAEQIPSPRDEEGESVIEPTDRDEAINMFHNLAHGSRNRRGSSTIAGDSSLLKAWRHLKATFRPGKSLDQRRQATNGCHEGSIDLHLVAERRQFIVDLANSSGLVANLADTATATEDLAALNKLHSNLIPAAYRATRDMSQLVDSSWWSE